jgi:hypothetical protein
MGTAVWEPHARAKKARSVKGNQSLWAAIPGFLSRMMPEPSLILTIFIYNIIIFQIAFLPRIWPCSN